MLRLTPLLLGQFLQKSSSQLQCMDILHDLPKVMLTQFRKDIIRVPLKYLRGLRKVTTQVHLRDSFRAHLKGIINLILITNQTATTRLLPRKVILKDLHMR